MATPNLGSSAANAQSAKNRIPGVCDCSDPVDKSALILYPSLGTPLLLKEGQSKCSIFIVGEGSLKGASGAGAATPASAPNLHVFIDRHLRLYSIKEKGAQTDTTVGTLFGDGKTCGTIVQHVSAWRVGRFSAGALIKDRHGRPFATVAPMAAKVYKDLAAGDIYEIEIDLKAGPFSGINAAGFMSFAWMVKLNDEGKKLLPGVTHAEPQDLMIAKFLKEQCESDAYHFKDIYEFDLADWKSTAVALPPQKKDRNHQLKSWHPVKYMPARALKLGHLSDVHVNVRQTAMGRSMARVLEGDGANDAWNAPVGTKVCNSFDALSALFKKMTAGDDKADAVLLTGDLIDFNRNLNPVEVRIGQDTGHKGIGDQWKAFNLLSNIDDKANGPRLYPRGLDDMLVFSLVREMYRKHSLPIFMTSGNHEAYQVPYGISARVEAGDSDNWAFKLGVLESTTANHRAARQQLEANAAKSWPGVPADNRPAEARRAQKVLAKKDAVEEHKKKIEAANAWTRGKANEGMSRDHNMTIYEACLAYGPTYGQALTGYNFHGDQFDWFYALFTPLADVVVAYGGDSSKPDADGALQVVTALGWGTDENFKNLLGYFKAGVDRQGAGILPRATESFSQDQLALVEQGGRYKSANKNISLTVASHFTIVSFDEPHPFSNVEKAKDKCSFIPENSITGPSTIGAFNHVNVGTCEKNQAVYLDQHVNAPGRRGTGAGVDWHLAGHSHRSGVYKIQWEEQKVNPRGVATRRVRVHSAKDPGIHGVQTAAPNTNTALIVSSCGGPIGYQNLDSELSAWTGRSPAGTLLNTATGSIKQVSTSRCRIEDNQAFNEKPRLAVALDYLHVMSGLEGKGGRVKNGAIEVPLRFKPCYFVKKGTLELVLSEQVKALKCVQGASFWILEGGTDENDRPRARKWHHIRPKLAGTVLNFEASDISRLAGWMTNGVAAEGPSALAWSPKSMLENYPNTESVQLRRRLPQAFCEVRLAKPANTKAGEDWGKDVVFDKDAWVFPLDIALIDGPVNLGGLSLGIDRSDPSYPATAVWYFGRPAGERGEVPDWKWLFNTFADKGYIHPLDAIKGK